MAAIKGVFVCNHPFSGFLLIVLFFSSYYNFLASLFSFTFSFLLLISFSFSFFSLLLFFFWFSSLLFSLIFFYFLSHSSRSLSSFFPFILYPVCVFLIGCFLFFLLLFFLFDFLFLQSSSSSFCYMFSFSLFSKLENGLYALYGKVFEDRWRKNGWGKLKIWEIKTLA